jgi:hypothetical protein
VEATAPTNVPAPTVRRATPAGLAVGAVCGCVLIAAVDPSEPGRYPLCPTRALLGIDCPACGTLRGLHAIFRGRLTDALSHNVLLAVAVPLGMALWFGLVRSAVAGRPLPALSPPRWLVAIVATVAVTYMVARNLPVAGLDWLASDPAP